MTPVRSDQHEINNEGRVAVLVPRFRNPKIAAFIISRKPKHFRIKLDEVGSAVWLRIDGQATVKDICIDLRAELAEKVEPAEERISNFLMHLYEQRYLNFKELL